MQRSLEIARNLWRGAPVSRSMVCPELHGRPICAADGWIPVRIWANQIKATNRRRRQAPASRLRPGYAVACRWGRSVGLPGVTSITTRPTYR